MSLCIPDRMTLIDYLVEAGQRYWPGKGASLVINVPIPVGSGGLGHAWRFVSLPEWLADLGVGDPPGLLVDAACLTTGHAPEWQRCDWWLAAFLHLSGAAEVSHELHHGPIHSFSTRLTKIPVELFDHAWVNRIFLVIRRVTARSLGTSEHDLFGLVPRWTIDLTHDVDAIRKTVPIRLKQTAFEMVNAIRDFLRMDLRSTGRQLIRSAKFLLSTPDYFLVDEVCEFEAALNLRSTFHIYARESSGPRQPKAWLFDPGYTLSDAALVATLRRIQASGWSIGLHASFDSWRDAARLDQERRALETSTGIRISRVRQHWLRFSWTETWRTQSAAGLTFDSTLGFNDRAGFRCGAALEFSPWDYGAQRPFNLRIVPLILMDSQLYAYARIGPEERNRRITALIDEVKTVGGTASILWHPHTFAADFGWGDGYRLVLQKIADQQAAHPRTKTGVAETICS